ncbi:formin-binding protein [Grosmannia clavigera kw1407]|uniref:Formin-binding protein n=1 Tax=Grosmannia clavigera (strain kw1407 / UAMH 11150) TaxID=655863 RepID=F0X9N8_GROCL|nr:formin-binding protein [Grosmannia clavigera kw1407]EFX06058.1 formin-binding protein [Grosmannia clavigera kw1407]
MADYWKSTPKYWCKNCSVYVTDTKFGRANHEATGKHQSAVRRALRDLHRDHDKQEREQERARREVARLNGIVDDSGDKLGPLRQSARPLQATPRTAAAETAATAPHAQLEQLAELGVSIPDAFRGELAMAGDWTVTTTRIVDTTPGSASSAGARAIGVRKRRRDGDADNDGDDAEDMGGGGGTSGTGGNSGLDLDAAVQGLFKRPRQWGRDSKTMPGCDGDLDNLLTSVLKTPTISIKKDAETVKKEEENEERKEKEGGSNDTEKPEEGQQEGTPATVGPGEQDEAKTASIKIKKEEEDGDGDEGGSGPAAPEPGQDAAPAGAILFKKRKAKPARHR